MKVKRNLNRDDLYCVYWKEPIEIGELYIEVIEDCLDEKIVKTYSYSCMDMLVCDHLDEYDEDPEIEMDY